MRMFFRGVVMVEKGGDIMESAVARRSVGTSILVFVGCIFVVFIFAAIAAVASITARGFYSELALPRWAPPAKLFSPVWTSLYLCMGVSLAVVVLKIKISDLRTILLLFLAQLSANALWGWIFFQYKSGLLATIEIVVLWCLIVATVFEFWKRSKFAALLLMPYLLWVSFATLLTFTVWKMNPSVLG